MNNERKDLGLDAFEMPDFPSEAPTVDSEIPTIEPVIEPVVPMIDDVIPVAPVAVEPVAPVIEEPAMPVIEEPVVPTIDPVMPVVEPVIDMPTIEPVIDIPVENPVPTVEPVIDDFVAPVAPTIDEATPVAPVIMEEPIMPSFETVTPEPVMPVVSEPTLEPIADTPVENFDYNFDFASQVNTVPKYNNSVPPVMPVEPEPVMPEVTPVEPENNEEFVSPVPIIMPDDDYEKSIKGANAENEGIIQGPGNQLNNTFSGYINDDNNASSNLRTANIVKEKEQAKDGKGNLAFLIVLLGIIIAFIILLPYLPF